MNQWEYIKFFKIILEDKLDKLNVRVHKKTIC